jgi:hypothetical protein
MKVQRKVRNGVAGLAAAGSFLDRQKSRQFRVISADAALDRQHLRQNPHQDPWHKARAAYQNGARGSRKRWIVEGIRVVILGFSAGERPIIAVSAASENFANVSRSRLSDMKNRRVKLARPFGHSKPAAFRK